MKEIQDLPYVGLFPSDHLPLWVSFSHLPSLGGFLQQKSPEAVAGETSTVAEDKVVSPATETSVEELSKALQTELVVTEPSQEENIVDNKQA